MSDKSNSIRPVGSNVTLTCTVDLDPAVDVPVIVNTEWTGPDNVALYPSYVFMVNLTRYVSTINVSSFGRGQSGNYTCSVDIDVSSLLPSLNYSTSQVVDEMIEVTVGKMPAILCKPFR